MQRDYSVHNYYVRIKNINKKHTIATSLLKNPLEEFSFVQLLLYALPGNISRTQLLTHASSRTIWYRLVNVFQGRRRLVLRLKPPFVVFAHATPPRFFSHRQYSPCRVPFPHANFSCLKLPGKSCVGTRYLRASHPNRDTRASANSGGTQRSRACCYARPKLNFNFAETGEVRVTIPLCHHDEKIVSRENFRFLNLQIHYFILLSFNSFALLCHNADKY